MAFSETLKDLDELRNSVKDYLEQARHSVKSFHRESDNAFWRDSEQAGGTGKRPKPNTIITARSYLALFYSEMALAEPGEVQEVDWLKWFRAYITKQPFSTDTTGNIWAADEAPDEKAKVERAKSVGANDENDHLNTFELAHLPDLILCKDICERFWQSDIDQTKSIIQKNDDDRAALLAALKMHVDCTSDRGIGSKGKADSDRKIERGETRLSEKERDSSHYFVTLHLLRGLEILGADSRSDFLPDIERVRAFCVEQVFYGQRGIRHKQDAFRLAFAGTVYCLYERNTERELVCAIVEALEKSQQENGGWPASHPIVRKNKEPWHIASHEIALCLTWLYFQPNVPEEARLSLLQMMERYFRNWVVATYLVTDTYRGWYDDHSIGEDQVVGWATAIVCHFLAAYYWVLCDWINRRVIEQLGIERHSAGYLIADDAPTDQRSTTWRRGTLKIVWPDLPPFRWQKEKADRLTECAARKLRQGKWTDPGLADGTGLISERIAQKILKPIYENPGNRPDRYQCSGLLPGKPGTGKSSLVRRVASALNWPRVSVPGSVIFDKGFDYLETRANEVFTLLNMLRSCVVFFDEFEEFLRKRPTDGESKMGNIDSHTRTIAAFTTSSMLTRMQELHDQASCLIFLATNHEEQIDDAAKRPGRVDFRLEVRHPTKSRLADFLDNPPDGLLKQLKVDLQSDQNLWNGLKEAVSKALSTEAVDKCVCSGTDLRDSCTIPFRYIEQALRAEQRMEGSAVSELLRLFKEETSNPPDLSSDSDVR